MKKLIPFLLALILVLGMTTIHSCKQEAKLTPEEAKSIAEEAYIFAYPMLMNYRSHYVVVINEKSPYFKGSYNNIVHDTLPADYTRKDVVAMNGDTPYSNYGLDLSGEPIVVSVPQITDRYYVMQCTDMYTHNFAYIGTRSTGTDAGDYLFVGPNWKKEIPEGKFKKVFHCETNYVGVICRTQLLGMDDLPNLKEIQKQYIIKPMSSFLSSVPVAAAKVDWPMWNPAVMNNVQFIDLFNFLLNQVTPINSEDEEAMKRFAKIGIGPGLDFDLEKMDSKIVEAINAGVKSGIEKITNKTQNIGEQVNGWNMTNAIGPRVFFKGDWLLRAAAAQAAMYMNDKVEAFYPLTFVDGDGNTLNAKDNNYILEFTKDQIPQAKYFWSVTMYDKSADDGVTGYMVKNSINRYLINSTTEGLKYNEDGGLTINIQHEKPSEDKTSNDRISIPFGNNHWIL